MYSDYAGIRETGIAHSFGARPQRTARTCRRRFSTTSAKVVAAVTVLGMAPQFNADPKGESARLLMQLGAELSGLLGGGGAGLRVVIPAPACAGAGFVAGTRNTLESAPRGPSVILAEAGIQGIGERAARASWGALGPRLRGDNGYVYDESQPQETACACAGIPTHGARQPWLH